MFRTTRSQSAVRKDNSEDWRVGCLTQEIGEDAVIYEIFMQPFDDVSGDDDDELILEGKNKNIS